MSPWSTSASCPAIPTRRASGPSPSQPCPARWTTRCSCSSLPDDILNFQHDPLAVAVALGWDGVTIETVPLALRMEDGWLREEERPGGRPTQVVTAVDGERFNEFWYQMMTG